MGAFGRVKNQHPKIRVLENNFVCLNSHPKMENAAKMEDIREATRDTTVIWVLIEGPAVSLKGSPTVSPVTAAL